MADFSIGEQEALLGLSVCVLACGLGPILWAPPSELNFIGRNAIYALTFTAFVGFSVLSATMRNWPGYLVGRFFQALFGSPCLAVGGASIHGLFSRDFRSILLGSLDCCCILRTSAEKLGIWFTYWKGAEGSVAFRHNRCEMIFEAGSLSADTPQKESIFSNFHDETVELAGSPFTEAFSRTNDRTAGTACCSFVAMVSNFKLNTRLLLHGHVKHLNLSCRPGLTMKVLLSKLRQTISEREAIWEEEEERTRYITEFGFAYGHDLTPLVPGRDALRAHKHNAQTRPIPRCTQPIRFIKWHSRICPEFFTTFTSTYITSAKDQFSFSPRTKAQRTSNTHSIQQGDLETPPTPTAIMPHRPREYRNQFSPLSPIRALGRGVARTVYLVTNDGYMAGDQRDSHNAAFRGYRDREDRRRRTGWDPVYRGDGRRSRTWEDQERRRYRDEGYRYY
ncbi:hypothetical protein AC578_8426 [Pseudocercospora eumusae]|uniref:Uncharacterized protein n=1 Tax=Pseudocercospora eumusae TaxID=321146 RepID=A0A139HS78_9PEZI|nr:hypothetical protein AC578_8426 [Pseudocercospora eumusae]